MTGGLDAKVKVWDTNSAQMVCEFAAAGKVLSVAMSPVATQHTLVAAACEDAKVQLCDPASGASTSSLH